MRAPLAAAVLAVALVANAAYALALPGLLAMVHPSAPLAIREGDAPITSITASFVAIDAGLDYRREPWRDSPSYPAAITGGIAAADVDGDGWVDLYFPPGGAQGSGATGARLYRNLGDWRFEDITDASGLAAWGVGAGAGFADYDNDGDPDLYVLVDDTGRLHRNDGGRFTDVTAEAGGGLGGLCRAPCQPSSLTWTDYDNDGRLDLFIVNNLDWRDARLRSSGDGYASLVAFGTPQRTVLFHNDGTTFHDAAADAQAWETAKGLGATAADLDGDGWPELLTANDVTPNAVLANQRDGTFRNIAARAGLEDARLSSMGIQAADLDGDLRPDIVSSNFRGEGLSAHFARPDGTWEHARSTDWRGLDATLPVTGWGVQLADFDLDGWLDVAHAVGRAVPLEPHRNDLGNLVFPDLREDTEDQLLRNLGGGRFALVAGSGFGDAAITRALLAVDLDNDGDLDVARSNLDGAPPGLLRNDLQGAPGWISLDLQGTRSNRDGVGAIVEATTPDGRTQRIELVSSAGYQTGLPGLATVGLGSLQEAHVVVRWPSGVVQDLGTLSAGAHQVVEPRAP